MMTPFFPVGGSSRPALIYLSDACCTVMAFPPPLAYHLPNSRSKIYTLGDLLARSHGRCGVVWFGGSHLVLRLLSPLAAASNPEKSPPAGAFPNEASIANYSSLLKDSYGFALRVFFSLLFGPLHKSFQGLCTYLFLFLLPPGGRSILFTAVRSFVFPGPFNRAATLDPAQVAIFKIMQSPPYWIVFLPSPSAAPGFC